MLQLRSGGNSSSCSSSMLQLRSGGNSSSSRGGGSNGSGATQY